MKNKKNHVIHDLLQSQKQRDEIHFVLFCLFLLLISFFHVYYSLLSCHNHKMMESSQELNSSSLTYDSDISTPLIITVVITMSFAAIIGTVGNTLVILVIVVYKKLRVVRNAFIINLALTDLIVTLIVLPFGILGAVDGGVFLKTNTAICEMTGTLSILCCVTSVNSIANIAVERYVFVCRQQIYNKIYNRVTIPLIVLGIWLYSLILDLPCFDFIGWVDHGYNLQTLSCTFLISEAKSGYSWFLITSGLVPAASLLLVCYVRIYLYVRRHSFIQPNSDPNSFKTATVVEADQRVLKIIFIIFFVFIFMLTPFCCVTLANTYVNVPNWLFFTSGNLLLANSSVNFIIYAFNKDFRDGYKLVFNLTFQRSNTYMKKNNTQRNNLRLYVKSRGTLLPQLSELSQQIRLSHHVEVL